MKTASIGVLIWLTALGAVSAEANQFPPGWLPLSQLEADTPSWSEFRDVKDRVHLYLPGGDKPVEGIFACFVFHSGDARELARLWNFALVTIPWPFEYDLGVNDKRNGRYKLGHPSQDMGLLLRYLKKAAQETGHPELATVPIVGWLGQNGSRLGADLYQRAPERVLAWADSFPNRLRTFPEFTKAVPFAFAWEASKKDLRAGERSYKKGDEAVHDLSCRASTYGFGHGIYSKFNFFMAYLDRCIKLRLPESMPAPGEPVKLGPVRREAGWLGDFDPIGEWNPIAEAKSPEAKSYRYPVWFPDAYMAHAWRSYHSSSPSLKMTGPVVEYRKKNGKWGGPDCGLGYGGELPASEPVVLLATAKGKFKKVLFYDGDRQLAELSSSPWTSNPVNLEPGLHVLYAVGVAEDGSKVASRATFLIMN